MSEIAKSLAVLATVLLMSVVGLEVGVRLFVDDGMQYDLEMWKYARTAKRVSNDAGIGHEHQPGITAHLMSADVRINSTRQRGRETSIEKPEGVFRILMLGDSLTFGWGVEEEDTTSRLLEKRLAEAYPDRKFEVVNCGVGNYNTAMSVNWYLATGWKFDPDLVILNYFINDPEPTPRRHGGFLRENSYAFVYFEGRIGNLWRIVTEKGTWLDYYRELYSQDAAGWQQAKNKVAQLSAALRKSGVPLLFVNYPELRKLAPYPFAEVSEKIRNLATANDLPYLDLLPTVAMEDPASLWVTVEDPHPNAKANRLSAERIFRELKDSPWLQRTGS